MKTVYLLPVSNNESNVVQEVLQRSNVTYLEIEKLHELTSQLSDPGDLVVRIPTDALTILVRHLGQILENIPVRVDAAPGSRYTHEFNIATASMTGITWDVLHGQFAKSGSVGNTPDEIEERSDLTSQGHKTEATHRQNQLRMRTAIKVPGSKEQAPSEHIDLDNLEESGDDVQALIG